MRRYKRPEPQSNQDPYQQEPLPFDRPIAVYYRQSGEGQVGNISTTLQTVDMVEHLERLGWVHEQILMIDMDAGFSGELKINERPGMSHLFKLIESGTLGAVASQEVDRFFRDVTQIQTNIFIDACKRNDVKVLTPTMIYDFAHPQQGRYHMQIFRERAQAAADFLEYHVRGRLVYSRSWLHERGEWAGRRIAPGYMVDMRERLPAGEKNPNYRKYVRFDAFADVVLAYFQLFRENNGNLQRTSEQVMCDGPFYPEFRDDMLSPGFVYYAHNNYRSKVNGKLVPSLSGLSKLFTNVVYIGHWIYKDAIVCWNNHEAIVPLDLFMFAFNRLSTTDFLGDPNPNYTPYRPWVRHDSAEREEDPPVYSGLVFSDDVDDYPHKRLISHWSHNVEHYRYELDVEHKKRLWTIKADVIDSAVDQLLLERLQATTIDEQAWQQALDSTHQGDHAEKRRIETAIRDAKRTQDNLIASLGTLSHTEMIRRAEGQYAALERDIERLTAELETLTSSKQHDKALIQARPALEKLITRWDDVPGQEKRSLFEAFAHHITLNSLNKAQFQVTIDWRDNQQSCGTIVRENKSGYYWTPEELEKLRAMVEANADQIDILRAFPHRNWRALRERYTYHFGSWSKTYTGKKTYPEKNYWADTEEAKTEATTQPDTNNPSTGAPPRRCAAGTGRSPPACAAPGLLPPRQGRAPPWRAWPTR